MEDQISRTVKDSIKVVTDSWSKDLAEIRSLLHELVGNVATSKPTPVEFQRFYGKNPELWISQAERYFDFYEIAENHKLSLASSYLDGAALSWYQWLFQNKQLVDWEHFTAKVLIRFRKRHLESPESRLSYQVYPQWSTKSNSTLLQNYDEQSESYPLASAYETGNSKVDQVFDKLPVRDSPHVGNAKTVDGAKLVEEPLPIAEDKVFDEISHTTVSSEIHDLNTIVHEGENFATTVAKICDDSVYRDVGSKTMVPTSVLVDTKESNTEEEDNPRDNVALFDKCPKRNTLGFLVPFISQGTVMLNVSMRIITIEYPFDGVLWHHTIPCLHNSLEEIYKGTQARVLPYLDFSLHKCNWVDTGQECNLPSFLSSNSRGCASEAKIQEVLQAIVVSFSRQPPYPRAVRLLYAMFGIVHKAKHTTSYIVFDPGPYLVYVAIYAIDFTFGYGKSVEEGVVTVLFERLGTSFLLGKYTLFKLVSPQMLAIDLMLTFFVHMGTCTYFHWESDVHNVGFNAQHKLSQFPFDLGAKFFIITIHITIMNLCVWDPGIDFKFRALTGYAANMEMLKLQGCSGKFCVIAYSNSMNRVWDPRESWCVNSSSQRGAIRGLGFAYVSAQTEQICSSPIPIFKGATTLVVLAFGASFLELIFVCSCNGRFALAAMLQERKVLKLRSAYKVKLQVVHPTGYTFYGVIQMIDLVAHLRERVNNAPSYQIKCLDMNLEDKVLFEGGSIVVTQAKSIGLIKILESFI